MKSRLLRDLFADDPEMLHALRMREMEKAFRDLVIPPGEKGDRGDAPTAEELTALIAPLIPPAIQGDPGETPIKGVDYFDGKPGADGKTPTKKELIDLIQPLIPSAIPGAPGKDAAPLDLDEIFIEFVDRIRKKKLIDISQIRNADSFIFNGTRYKTHELMHGGGSASTGSAVFSYDISSQFNGILTLFTVPTYASILQITLAGWPPNSVMRPTVDFTTPSTTTIQFDAAIGAPVAGTSGIVLYTTS